MADAMGNSVYKIGVDKVNVFCHKDSKIVNDQWLIGNC